MESDSLRAAVDAFWTGRDDQAREQRERGTRDRGSRGSTAGGQHLNPLCELVKSEFLAAGITEGEIQVSNPTLPGYYRPTKKWDLVVTREDSLVAAVELKSMVGSEGNNLNNRSEEAIGNAVDLRRAFDSGLLGPTPPWLGYFFVLGETDATHRPVATRSNRFPVDPNLDGSSYAQRAQLLLERLLDDGIYNGACFITTRPGSPASVEQPSQDLSFEAFRERIRERIDELPT
jgi:hypothetical protein